MLKFDSLDLSKFFISQEETDHRSLVDLGDNGGLDSAYRAVMVSDGTLTQMLAALHLEDIVTTCVENDRAVPDPEQRAWLEIGDEPCVRRRVTLSGASTGATYVRALSYLYQPRLPDTFLDELDRPGASLGTQMIQSRISSRRELIWVRQRGDGSYSRLYRILVQDRPAILIQEDFVDLGTPA